MSLSITAMIHLNHFTTEQGQSGLFTVLVQVLGTPNNYPMCDSCQDKEPIKRRRTACFCGHTQVLFAIFEFPACMCLCVCLHYTM